MFYLFTFMHISILSVYIYVHYMCAWYLWGPEEGIRSLGIGVTDGCKPPCGCWKLNLGSLEEKSVVLTAKLSLQLPWYIVFKIKVIKTKRYHGLLRPCTKWDYEKVSTRCKSVTKQKATWNVRLLDYWLIFILLERGRERESARSRTY